MNTTRWVIAGGGTAGWIAASALAHQYRDNQSVSITLVESSDIGTVGVGEAVIPPFVTFIRNLGLDEQKFIAAVGGTFKLGIEFKNWRRQNHSYFHHFGALGRSLNGNDFYHCFLHAEQAGACGQLMEFAPSAVMAKRGRFFLPFKLPEESGLTGANYALHFDASRVATELRRFACDAGVKHLDAKIDRVRCDNSGNIKALQLNSGEQLEGDYFIDCSGFRSLLLGQTLATPYDDWSDLLPCNSAAAVQSEHIGDTPPFTTATAQDAGWIWGIPLQHRMGNGYVYSKEHISDDEASATLLAQLTGKPLHDPRILRFTTGMRKHLWVKNCIGLGLAGGFLEPLESTAIHLVTRGIQFLLQLLPTQATTATQCNALAAEYNQRMRADYEEIRDFLVLHYCLTERDDAPFWRYVKTMPLPASLEHRLALFDASGQLPPENDELFKKPSWQAVLHGMGRYPGHYHPAVNQLNPTQVNQALNAARQQMAQACEQLPSHDQFIEQFCAAPQAAQWRATNSA